MKKFVTYIRVSTQKQGRSGLGLESQRAMCQNFVSAQGGEIVNEFMDVESGSHRDRAGLWQAIDYCKRNACPLVIAKLDRLARDVEFTFKVINTGIEIHFTDMPMVNTMILGVFASVAQYERELICARTKAALQAKKERGEKMGAASDNYKISREASRRRSVDAGSTRRRRVLEHRDTQALIRIMKQVFPILESTDVDEWKQSMVSTKAEYREVIFAKMADYKAIDSTGKLFATWDLSDTSSPKLAAKLASKMQSIIKMLTTN